MLTSCETEEASPTIESDGAGSAKINGMAREAIVIRHDKGSKFTIVIEKYGENLEYDAQESIGIYLVGKQRDSLQQIYPVDTVLGMFPHLATKVYGSFHTSQQGNGDVLCDSYQVIETDTVHNWLRIDKQVNDFAEVWGSFEMKLYREIGCNTSPYPDTLHITEGRFYYSE